MQKIIVSILILVCLSVNSGIVSAQKNEDALSAYQRVEGSYIIGAQVYNDNFLYNPGASLTFSYGASINKYASIGIGSGYQAFDDEKFIPLYMDVIGLKKGKKNIPYLNMQVGYSIGWADSYNGIESYDYQGGIYVNAGIGRKILLNDKISLLIQCAYRHQSARMELKTSDANNYNQNLNYDMIVFTLGIMAVQ